MADVWSYIPHQLKFFRLCLQYHFAFQDLKVMRKKISHFLQVLVTSQKYHSSKIQNKAGTNILTTT